MWKGLSCYYQISHLHLTSERLIISADVHVCASVFPWYKSRRAAGEDLRPTASSNIFIILHASKPITQWPAQCDPGRHSWLFCCVSWCA
ncbi:hypothetical protein AOLI_G00139620 [Acnodon oligacanthus]